MLLEISFKQQQVCLKSSLILFILATGKQVLWQTVKTQMKCHTMFQGGTSFVDLLCFCSVLCLLCFVRVCALWSPAGKGLTSWLSFVVSTVSLSLSHWYPGSGVVLNCIDSRSLHPYLLYFTLFHQGLHSMPR